MNQFQKCILAVLSLMLLQGCASKTVWYRGNTHAHTVICGHADSPPEVVTQWYHDHGYNFLILSEHNHFIDPDSVQMPEDLRDNFILIPGEEISGPRIIHSTAMNIRHLVMPDQVLQDRTQIIQNHVDITRSAEGRSILNHPNYYYAASADDIFPVKDLYMLELYNGHPAVANAGDEDHPSTEQIWDDLLTRGMTVFGVSSDDAHYFSTLDSAHSNPGRGWVMVDAPELSGAAITKAMNQGSFYASNGVILSQCSVIKNKYRVVVDLMKTQQQLLSPALRGQDSASPKTGYHIEFIGPEGQTLIALDGSAAVFPLKKAPAYIRPRISYSRSNPRGGTEVFYAWGQPVFTDGRGVPH